MASLDELHRVHVERIAEQSAALLTQHGFDGLLIHSGSLEKRTSFDDIYWPLRTVPYFEQWAHLDWPECAIHYTPGKRPTLFAFRDKSYWERPREPNWSSVSQSFDLIEVSSPKQIGEQLKAPHKIAFVGENVDRAIEWGVPEDNWCPPPLLEGMNELRVHKSEYEIACLSEANRIASLGHKAVAAAFKAGMRNELKLHLLYLETTGQDDWETPYKNIVALGHAASILHHVYYEKADKDARSLLLDAGARCRGYASDITRTYVAEDGGEGARIFAELVRRMEALQQALVASVSVGRPYEELHDEAHQRLGGVLVESGLVKMSAEECTHSGVSRSFMPHGLGHSLGLVCHDVGCAKIRPRGDNPWLRNTRAIEPGQVFTIEPGLYFIDTLMAELKAGPHAGRIDWKSVDAVTPFGGIRIEDDVLVLPGGSVTTSDNLTRAHV